jgi:predicted transcriptional regulator
MSDTEASDVIYWSFDKFTQVEEITRSYRWAPFLPVQHDDSMLTVLVLLTKFRMRSIPVIDIDQGVVQNMISQSSVVKGLSQCQGRDWFDSLASKSIHQLGLPVMAPDQVTHVERESSITWDALWLNALNFEYFCPWMLIFFSFWDDI